MHDCLVIGGGVIGLSLAYELAGGGLKVRVVDRREPAQEASWAGAGIFPPPCPRPDAPPLAHLEHLGFRLQSQWAERLREETGIDNGFRQSGALHLAGDPAAAAELDRTVTQWTRDEIPVEPLTSAAVADMEPALGAAVSAGHLHRAALLPTETQYRTPWHLRALLAGCARRKVEVSAGIEVDDFLIRDGRVAGVRTPQGLLTAGKYCLAAGAWSGSLLDRLGVRVVVKPIRGQIVLLSCNTVFMRRMVYVGTHYVVPRGDGRFLIGSTLEDVGFDRRNTADAIRDLLDFAHHWVPGLDGAQIERCWAGLRPASGDGLPYLGRIPNLENMFVAAGHFRAGLLLAPATAVLMAQLIRGEKPELDLEAFGVDRVNVNRVSDER